MATAYTGTTFASFGGAASIQEGDTLVGGAIMKNNDINVCCVVFDGVTIGAGWVGTTSSGDYTDHNVKFTGCCHIFINCTFGRRCSVGENCVFKDCTYEEPVQAGGGRVNDSGNNKKYGTQSNNEDITMCGGGMSTGRATTKCWNAMNDANQVGEGSNFDDWNESG